MAELEHPPAPPPALRTVADVRALLGIKTPRQLRYLFAATEKAGGPYRVTEIPKRSGGARRICAPCPKLKHVQRLILDALLYPLPVRAEATGFVPGASIATNAAPHARAALVVNFDLKDFFPTITYLRVVGLFERAGYPAGGTGPRRTAFSADDASDRVAQCLARLCCYAPTKRWNAAHLPQGAPTSPALSNLACRRLDSRLAGLARSRRGAYTRYADDITLSYPPGGSAPDPARLRAVVEGICRDEGFEPHPDKFRVRYRNRRQEVTGLVVNDGVRVPKRAKRLLRAMVHNARRNGLAAEAAKTRQHDGDPAGFAAYLRGVAAFVHMVEPARGLAFMAAVEEVCGD